MKHLLHAVIAWFMEPAHVRIRDHVAHWATFHIPGVARIRGWYRDRDGRPGFRASDYR